MVKQFFAMQNDPPLALAQEATSPIGRGWREPLRWGKRPDFGL
jgi:hypothetical protein